MARTQKPVFFEADLGKEKFELYSAKKIIAVDTETRGLVVPRDRLCLVQICDDEDSVSIVRYCGHPAPRLRKLMETDSVTKIFHFARFDIAALKHYLGATVQPVWCTKIASKIVRTYTDKHGLKDLALEFLGITMDKTNQTSDWAQEELTESQLEYAASDVRVLIPIYHRLEAMLKRENRTRLAESLFSCVTAVSDADLNGWPDIFSH